MGSSVVETAISPELSAAEFGEIRRIAHERFGLDLRPGKETLVMARLGKHIRRLKLPGFREYCRHVLADATGEALVAMIDALVTNYTGFFREGAHFDFLRRTVLPAARGRLRVWSAACATGEEPYTLALVLLEHLGAQGRFEIVASDISTRALNAARAGIYPAGRLEGLDPQLMRKYLLMGGGRWQGHYQVKPEVRARVDFRRVNLVEDFSQLGKFNLIFCRNVMIYFDRGVRERLVARLADRLEPGGYLFVGHAESLTGIGHTLEYVRPAVYRKRGTR